MLRVSRDEICLLRIIVSLMLPVKGTVQVPLLLRRHGKVLYDFLPTDSSQLSVHANDVLTWHKGDASDDWILCSHNEKVCFSIDCDVVWMGAFVVHQGSDG